jgi:hypothetical protein
MRSRTVPAWTEEKNGIHYNWLCKGGRDRDAQCANQEVYRAGFTTELGAPSRHLAYEL